MNKNRQIPEKLYHFTKAEKALKILESKEFHFAPVFKCNDPFELDHYPVFIEFKSKQQINWYCEQTHNIISKIRTDIKSLNVCKKN